MLGPFFTSQANSLVDIDVSSEVATFSPPLRQIIVGGAGVLRCKLIEDSAYHDVTVAAGQVLDWSIVAIDTVANGTTATLMTGVR
ncbi:MAG: hypothetical protein AB7F99_09475 [Vicinamibacterales bacterium]